MYFEMNGKYRLVDADAFQTSAGLQIGARAFGPFEGYSVTAPLWLSYDVAKKLNMTVFPHPVQ